MLIALSKAGFNMSANLFKEYEKFSEVRLPFGSTVSSTDNSIGTEFSRQQLDGINYIRKTAEGVSVDKLVELCPCIDKNNKYLAWMIDNIEKIKIINKGGYTIENHGYLGKHTSYDERQFKRDSEYGFSDVVCGFVFDTQRMTVKPLFDKSTLNYIYQKDIVQEVEMILRDKYHFNITDDTRFMLIKHFTSHMEFIPFYVAEFDGVRVSHKSYINNFGIREDEVTSPCLGINIKKHTKIMNGLTDFIANGGYIKDDVFYLIHQAKGAPDGTYYLRRYEKWSPRINKTI